MKIQYKKITTKALNLMGLQGIYLLLISLKVQRLNQFLRKNLELIKKIKDLSALYL